jgi:hypothetical protein
MTHMRVAAKRMSRKMVPAESMTTKGMTTKGMAAEGVTAATADMRGRVAATTAVPAASAATATTLRRHVGCDEECAQGDAGGENSNYSFAFGHGLPPSSVALTFPSAYPGATGGPPLQPKLFDAGRVARAGG